MTDPLPAAAEVETDRFFREVVLCLGGIFAVHECDDALVWRVTKSLDHIYQRHRTRLRHDESRAGSDVPQRQRQPHRAVEDLLSRIGQRGAP
jgi:hypothetical protein